MLILLATVLAGCSMERLPSQASPSCSWAVDPPANHDALCRIAFGTLRAVVRAEAKGNDGTVYRFVPVPRIARLIISQGKVWRRQGLTQLHIVPSMTLSIAKNGYLGAGFYILGSSRAGRIRAPQTVYILVRGSTGAIVGDQPSQEW